MTEEIQSEKRLRVLITSPSMVESDNISGISTVVRQIINHCDCDFVHFSAGRKDNEKAGLIWLLKQIVLPVRFLWTILRQKIDVVHINTAFAPPAIVRDLMLTITAKFVGRPVLLHPNGGKYLLNEIPGAALHHMTGEMLYTADRILVLSEIEKENLVRRWKKLKIVVLANAIDTEEIKVSDAPNQQKEIIFFGRIDSDKGLDEIVETCRILKSEGFDFTFTCCGTGPESESFSEAMTEVLGKNFVYRGVVSGSEKWNVLAKADIFLLPSYFEGLPLSMLESMAAKCVVVASDVGSIGTAVTDGVNGFLVEPRNTQQIVEKLKQLLSDGADWKSLRDNARETVEKDYSIRNYVLELLKIYKSLV